VSRVGPADRDDDENDDDVEGAVVDGAVVDGAVVDDDERTAGVPEGVATFGRPRGEATVVIVGGSVATASAPR